VGWTVETLNEVVDAEVEALPEDMRARLARIAALIFGACEKLPTPAFQN